MDAVQRRAIVTIGFAAGVGCALLVLLNLRYTHGTVLEAVAIGLIIGTLFGQTTLAAVWSALGPLGLAWRLPLSLAWLAALVSAFTINVALENGPPPRLHAYHVSFLVVLAGCLLAQWVIVQIPLWCFVLGYGWGLRPHDDQAAAAADPRLRQFGIRQLMVLTAIVGVLLGVGRATVLYLAPGWQLHSPDTVTTTFLAVAAVATTLPLIVAALLPRGAIMATAVILVLIALATIWEEPLFKAFGRNAGSGPNLTAVFAWTNAMMAGWICLVILGLRLSGYGLSTVRGADG